MMTWKEKWMICDVFGGKTQTENIIDMTESSQGSKCRYAWWVMGIIRLLYVDKQKNSP